VRLHARDQRRVDSFDIPTRHPRCERFARWGKREQFGMAHRDRSSIGEMDVECLKGPGLVYFSELFDRHDSSLAMIRSIVKGRLGAVTPERRGSPLLIMFPAHGTLGSVFSAAPPGDLPRLTTSTSNTSGLLIKQGTYSLFAHAGFLNKGPEFIGRLPGISSTTASILQAFVSPTHGRYGFSQIRHLLAPRLCLSNGFSGIMKVGGFRKEAHHATPL
jgi:hypothetical protein